MKRLLLITTGLLLLFPDIAMAAQQAQVRPTPAAPKPARPTRPQPRPPVAKPNPGRPNPGRPRPPGNLVPLPKPTPARPKPKPPRPRPPGNDHRPVRPHPLHKWPIWRPGQPRPPHFKPIHRPGWHYPHGYHYRRWAIGLILPTLFLNRTYYYTDYDALGVGPPPYGYRWVRYGPDLLLVQRSNGRIADVIYGAFY